MSRPQPGDIVIANWRDVQPLEANKRRPAVVIEGERLFADDHVCVLLVPLTSDQGCIIEELSVRIDPCPENGCAKLSWALPFMITATSLRRIERTASRINKRELQAIRERIAISAGIT